jgi:hypothetical protein
MPRIKVTVPKQITKLPEEGKMHMNTKKKIFKEIAV